MNILYTAFNGKNNSSKILLDNISCNEENKLYLKNSFDTSVKQLQDKLKNSNYDLIISFGQAPLDNDTIKIETRGTSVDFYETNYDFTILKDKLELKDFNVLVPTNAGNYLCNNIYYNGLKYIYNNKLNCNMIFIHIPKIKNIDINLLASLF